MCFSLIPGKMHTHVWNQDLSPEPSRYYWKKNHQYNAVSAYCLNGFDTSRTLKAVSGSTGPGSPSLSLSACRPKYDFKCTLRGRRRVQGRLPPET